MDKLQVIYLFGIQLGFLLAVLCTHLILCSAIGYRRRGANIRWENKVWSKLFLLLQSNEGRRIVAATFNLLLFLFFWLLAAILFRLCSVSSVLPYSALCVVLLFLNTALRIGAKIAENSPIKTEESEESSNSEK